MYKVCAISVFLTDGYEQAIYYIKYVYLISMQRLIQIASVKAIIDPGEPSSGICHRYNLWPGMD